MSSSADAILGTRAAGNLLTKASWWCGGLFLGLAFLLSLMSAGTRRPASVLDEAFTPAPPTTPAPRTAAPALPLEEVTPAPGTKGQSGAKTPGATPSGGAPAGTKAPTGAAPTTPAQPETKRP